MKKLNKLPFLIAGIILTTFLVYGAGVMQGAYKQAGKPWPCPQEYIDKACPIKADAGIIDAGKQSWNQECKSCHGRIGKGDGVKARTLDIACADLTSSQFQKQTDGEIFYRITEGRKPMPTHKLKLSDTDRWALVLYIRTLSKYDAIH